MHTASNFRLLVVRLGAMGDILHGLPAVAALRRAHPEWEIGWVVEPKWSPLLRAESRDRGSEVGRGPAQPLVDRLHFAPLKQWAKRPLTLATARAIAALRRELRAARYHAVIDFQGAVRSAIVARFAAAPRTIGESHPREHAARWLFSQRVITHGAHVIEQDLELASAIAADALKHIAPPLPVDPDAEAWCDRLLASAPGGPIALIAPGAGWGAKRWPVDRYGVVAAGLIARGMRVYVNAGPGEESMAAAIQQPTAAIPLTTTLPQLIALTRRIALCVAGDTGPLHLACALERPVVGIYGPTDPSRNGPYGTRSAVLRSPLSRRDHSRHAAPEAGLLTITPGDVLLAADKLMREG